MRPDAERYEICNWLEHSDPSPNHNAACELYEKGTGDWVFQTDEWKAWRDKQFRCLWIHGIPGAGKTILAAHLTEALSNLEIQPRGANAQVAFVYYYCFHARNQNETGPFIRWVVSQLCRKSEKVPSRVYDIFKLGGQPTPAKLLASLEELLGYFERVFITVDAVDESQQRESLLAVLADLATVPRYSKIQLLVTSREYLDIKETMSGISQPLSMSNPHVEADIERYVGVKLGATRKFRFWPSGLSDEVQHALAVGAKGMFRWAVCQLDILRRLNDVTRIRVAIKDLPQTLDETYIRIFSCVDENDWPLLRHTLRLICFHNTIYPVDLLLTDNIVLSAYSAFGIADRNHNPDHFYISESLEDICGCLVTFLRSDNHSKARLSLAHYTVREFIESDRCSLSAAAYFFNQPVAWCPLVFASVLKHALAIDPGIIEPRILSRGEATSDFILSDFNAYCYRSLAVGLGELESLIVRDKTQMALVFDFLNPMDPHFSLRARVLKWLDALFYSDVHHGGFVFWELEWISPASDPDINILVNFLFGGYMIMAGTTIRKLLPSRLSGAEFSLVFSCYDEMTSTHNSHQFTGSLINFIAQCSRFRRKGAAPLTILYRRLLDEPGQPLIHPTVVLANYSGPHDHVDCEDDTDCKGVVNWLLKLGADPNATGYRVTPLQIAVANRDWHGVRSLLEAGADPSSLGDANGVEWNPETVSGHFFNDLHGSSPLYILQNREKFKTRRVPTIYLGVKDADSETDSEFDESELEERDGVRELLLAKGGGVNRSHLWH